MLEKELGTLKEYIDTKLAKKHIKESTSLARALVMFVPKKNRKLQLVVDYKQLNNMTTKDRYSTPLLKELND